MENNQNYQNNEQILYLNLESQIKSNQFKTKEELIQRISKLKEYGRFSSENSNDKIKELLELYDKLHKTDESVLNTEKYKNVSTENINLIISTEDDKILKTSESNQTMNEEFKQLQNEIVANSKDGQANADTLFNHMANYQKEEIKILSISDVLLRDDIDKEVLKKIRFFLSNSKINPYNYKVDIINGIFYNQETDEVIEVRKNEETLEYEIYRSGEMIYKDEEQSEKVERNEEQLLYDSKENHKVRRLTPPNKPYGFSNVSFLILNIMTFILLTTMIILLNK